MSDCPQHGPKQQGWYCQTCQEQTRHGIRRRTFVEVLDRIDHDPKCDSARGHLNRLRKWLIEQAQDKSFTVSPTQEA